MGLPFGSTRPTMDWRASSQPGGGGERSETHHPATRAPPRKAMGFAFGSTHPTMDWRASSQPVGWVERSETHHPATRAPPRKAMGFAFGSTHPTNGLAGVLAARRMGRAQRNPSSRDPDPAAQSDGFRLWLYPSYGLASADRKSTRLNSSH